jgi:hypothetical protein
MLASLNRRAILAILSLIVIMSSVQLFVARSRGPDWLVGSYRPALGWGPGYNSVVLEFTSGTMIR